MIPPDYPGGTSPGEALVFEALRPAGVAPDWTVLHSLHLPDHVRQVEGEADFVILMPGAGVLCLEVKGHLRADYVNGAWYLGSDPAPDYRGPFRQAEMACRSVRKKVTSSLPAASGVLLWPAVIFTHCVPGPRAETGDWHPWELITSADLERLVLDKLLLKVISRAREHVSKAKQARWFDPSSQRPTVADCTAIRRALRPDVHLLPATSAIRQRRRDEIRRFTEEQLEVIEGLDGVNERALVEGPAGTGKTVLAFEEARRASAVGARAGLLCFNRPLAAYLRSETEAAGLGSVEVTTIHALMLRLAGRSAPEEVAGRDTQEFWTRTLPDLAVSAVADQRPRFDLLIIDEAQDLAEPAYLEVLDGLLEGGLSAGRWRMFGDFERQAIYSKAPAEAVAHILARGVAVARYCLRRNCRNTPRVAEYIVRLGGLSPAYTRVLRPDCGPESTPRTSFYSSREHQSGLLRATLGELLAAGEYASEDIVVLSPVTDSCGESLHRSGGYPGLVPLAMTRSSSPSYGTVASFKGLEAPAVVLTDIEEVATNRAQRLFYIGVSRATDHLHVFARDGLQGDVARLVTGGREDGIH